MYVTHQKILPPLHCLLFIAHTCRIQAIKTLLSDQEKILIIFPLCGFHFCLFNTLSSAPPKKMCTLIPEYWLYLSIVFSFK